MGRGRSRSSRSSRSALSRSRSSGCLEQVALDLFAEKKASGELVNHAVFVSDFCRPMYVLAKWESSQVQSFRSIATGFGAFARIVQNLKTDRGRKAILQCCQDRVPLHGHGSAPGIPECQALVEQMRQCSDAKAKAQDGAGTESNSGEPTVEGGGDAPQAHGSSGEDLNADLLLIDGPPTDAEDPFQKHLNSLIEKDRLPISMHWGNSDTFKLDVAGRVLPSHKIGVWVEAPTSKARVVHHLVALAKDCFPAGMGYALALPLGDRLEVLEKLRVKFKTDDKKTPAYTIMVGNPDMQGERSMPAFVLCKPHPQGTKQVPCLVDTHACRSKPLEGIRLRCVNSACKHRGQTQTSEEGAGALDTEVQLSDEETAEPAGEYEEDDMSPQEQDATRLAELEQKGKKTKEDRATKLFPFASPVSYYVRLLSKVLGADSLTHLVILTRTAHPAILMAALELKLETVCYVEGA